MSDKPPPASSERIMRAIKGAITGKHEPGEEPAEVSVLGVDDDGMTVLRVELEGNLYQVKVPDLRALVQSMGPMHKPTREGPLLVPYVPKTLGELPAKLERLETDGVKRLVWSGDSAQLSRPLEGFLLPWGGAVAFTSRGPTAEKQGMEYKPINEDGVLVIARRHGGEGDFLLGAFDMAGGEGHVENQSGAASHAAATTIDALSEKIFAAQDVEAALYEAVEKSATAVKALEVGAVCTLTLALVRQEGDKRLAHVAVCGDSRVLHVGKDGTLKAKTILHNLGSMVAAGQVETAPRSAAPRYASVLARGLGGNDEEPDFYDWELAPGDWLVLETDGIGDAREFEATEEGTWHADGCATDQAAVLHHAKDAEDGARLLLAYALDQMASGYGKPDNVGLVVLKVT